MALSHPLTLNLTLIEAPFFSGDHGYQNGEKGEWCKSNNFELATRIPMYLSPPRGPSGTTDVWSRGAISSTPVESLDLYPTLVDLTGSQLI